MYVPVVVFIIKVKYIGKSNISYWPQDNCDLKTTTGYW